MPRRQPWPMSQEELGHMDKSVQRCRMFFSDKIQESHVTERLKNRLLLSALVQ